MKKAQKILALFLAAILMVMSFAACGNTSEDAASNAADSTAESPLKVVYYVSGQLGDKSFFDSSNRGLERAVSELGIVGKTVEGGYDQSFWEPDLMELAEADWDVIVVGTYEMVEILQRVAVMHPEKKFIIFDAEVDYWRRISNNRRNYLQRGKTCPKRFYGCYKKGHRYGASAVDAGSGHDGKRKPHARP